MDHVWLPVVAAVSPPVGTPMFLLIGLVVVFGSVIGGYVWHHGNLAVLVQPSEFLIIGGAAIGSMIVGNSPALLKSVLRECLHLLKPNPYNRASYSELLQVMYQVFAMARKDGLNGLDAHIEDPQKSAIFAKYPFFQSHENAVAFFTDTLKVLLTGAIEDHHLNDILEADLEKQHHEAMAVPKAITTAGDAMPGFGIVAAVLGVIITMGTIGGPAAEVGMKIAAALVGTFLGILLCYGVFGPMAQAIEGRIRAEHNYMLCIKQSLLGFARGDAPMTAVEFARRNIEPTDRPSFAELEQLARRKS